jgi:hypothetical protein
MATMKPRAPRAAVRDYSFYERFSWIAGFAPEAPRWPVRWRTRCACLDDYEQVREEFLASCPTWPGKRPIWAEQAREFRAKYGDAMLERASYSEIRPSEAPRITWRP